MTTKEKARLKALEQKDKQWNDFMSEYLRNTPFEKRTENDFEYDGLTNDELEEYNRLCHKRYWEWVLTDSEKEEAQFEALRQQDDAWRQQLQERIRKSQNSEPQPTNETPEEREVREKLAFDLFLRHGMSENDWYLYQRLTRKRTLKMWLDFLGGNGDFDWEYLLQLLQFKIDRFADYWGRFALVENSEYYRKRMQLASRLLQIVLNRGNESGDYDKFPYRVNIRNKERFKVYHNPYAHNPCNKQEVRFNKAYCLFFKLLQKNLLSWWY